MPIRKKSPILQKLGKRYNGTTIVDRLCTNSHFLLRRVDFHFHEEELKENEIDRECLTMTFFLKIMKDDTQFFYMFTNKEGGSRLLGKTRLSSMDNITFIHDGGENDKGQGKGKGKARQEYQEEEEETYHLPKYLRHLQLPTLNFNPKNAREKLLHKEYSTQKKINSWMFKAFEKMKTKLRRTPGYVSSVEEEDEEEVVEEEEEQEEEENESEEEEQEFVLQQRRNTGASSSAPSI
ncbi:unnamed protein product [Cochlearia groenlandica]